MNFRHHLVAAAERVNGDWLSGHSVVRWNAIVTPEFSSCPFDDEQRTGNVVVNCGEQVEWLDCGGGVAGTDEL